MSDGQVAFRWKDYRRHGRAKVMTLAADEFIRRFLLHTLPDGFHRIRHYGFLANGHRAAKPALCRRLIDTPATGVPADAVEDKARVRGPAVCPRCGGVMMLTGVLPRRVPERPRFRDDSS
jgi:hypothetical protein